MPVATPTPCETMLPAAPPTAAPAPAAIQVLAATVVPAQCEIRVHIGMTEMLLEYRFFATEHISVFIELICVGEMGGEIVAENLEFHGTNFRSKQVLQAAKLIEKRIRTFDVAQFSVEFIK